MSDKAVSAGHAWLPPAPPREERHAGNSLIGPLLAGAWRVRPPACSLTPSELACVAPLVLGSGAAALAWARISRSALAEAPEAARIREAALRSAITNAAREAALARIVSLLNTAGVTPLIFKGWSVARHYAHAYLRPYGDFDLLVSPSESIQARKTLIAQAAPALSQPSEGRFGFDGPRGPFAAVVDFHQSLPSFYAISSDALFARARRLTLAGGQTLLEPCPEDHLRIVVLHFLKHGGWRPLWLCDIAAMAERAGADFDWTLCFGDDAITRPWIESGVAAARDLLGCDIPGPPALRAPPRWLIATIMREWRSPYSWRFRAPVPRATPRFVIDKLASYWLNPISSSILRGRRLSPLRPVHHQIEYAAFSIGKAMVKSARRAPSSPGA